jgi:phosphohistidine swiveling domain-containing protein
VRIFFALFLLCVLASLRETSPSLAEEIIDIHVAFSGFVLDALSRSGFVALEEEKLRSALALLGVCLGVSVVVAIALANAATLRSFHSAVDVLAGRAQLEIRPNGGPLDERLLAEVVRFPWVEAAAPALRFDASPARRWRRRNADRPGARFGPGRGLPRLRSEGRSEFLLGPC